MKKESKNDSYKIFIKAFILEIIVTAVFIFVFAAIMYFLEAGFEYSAVFATISIALGCLAAAFYAAKKIGKKGMLSGLIIGGITFLLVTIISLIVDSGSITINTLFHLIIMLLSSVIGGVLGVNKGQNKKYI